MRKILVVGIGAGNPEHMTVQAIDALNRADVLFIPDKGEAKSELAGLRRAICDRFVTNPDSRRVEFEVPVRAEPAASYRATVDDWHEAIAGIYEALIRSELAEDGCGAFLIWGDPSLYDSALRILERVRARGNVEFALEVVPGITAVQALAAGHRMALNRIGDAFLVTTGRRLTQEGMPDDAGTAVVLRSQRPTPPGPPGRAPHLPAAAALDFARRPDTSGLRLAGRHGGRSGRGSGGTGGRRRSRGRDGRRRRSDHPREGSRGSDRAPASPRAGLIAGIVDLGRFQVLTSSFAPGSE